MCGIAGIWHLNKRKLEPEKLKRFTDSIQHRGPDGSGYKVFEDAGLGLGHRRLSILDLSPAGHQPMTFADGRWWMSFNGEVYNFIEIRNELRNAGFSFRSDSDSEVVMAAYHYWGLQAFNRFNGMWAIAIYDTQTGNLLLCRDRFGVKPLYYTFEPDKIFAFASETFAFKFLDDFKIEFDEKNLNHSLLNPVMIEGSGNTIFKNIYQLLPGHYAEVSSNSTAIRQHRWFEIPQRYNTAISFGEASEEFGHLLEEAVKLRLRSDVPVASALSGGLDSSSVYCMLQHIKKKGEKVDRSDGNYLKAFVATFKDTPQDERVYAEEVIRYTQGQVHYVETDFDKVITSIESSCELFNDITATPISVLSEVYGAMRHNGITVSMDGHGVDEMLYGYKSLAGQAVLQALGDGNQEQFDDLKNTYLDLFSEDEKKMQAEKFDKKVRQLKAQQKNVSGISAIKRQLKKSLHPFLNKEKELWPFQPVALNSYFTSKGEDALSYLSAHKVKLGFYNTAERELAIDFNYRNIPYNMRDFDRAAMQHGIEIRMPFMDYRLVSFVFSLPMSYKIGGGFTKRILREAMKGKMPESIRTRKTKIGMGAPLDHWFNGPLNTYLTDVVTSQLFLQSPYWNGGALRLMVEKKCKERSWTLNEAQGFWNFLNAYILYKANG